MLDYIIPNYTILYYILLYCTLLYHIVAGAVSGLDLACDLCAGHESLAAKPHSGGGGGGNSESLGLNEFRV